jgi:hypothetical protein
VGRVEGRRRWQGRPCPSGVPDGSKAEPRGTDTSLVTEVAEAHRDGGEEPSDTP